MRLSSPHATSLNYPFGLLGCVRILFTIIKSVKLKNVFPQTRLAATVLKIFRQRTPSGGFHVASYWVLCDFWVDTAWNVVAVNWL